MSNPSTLSNDPAGSVMEPPSGTYGEVKETEQLAQDLALPGTAPGPQPGGPPAPMPGQPPQGQAVPAVGGLPSVLMGPSSRPDEAITAFDEPIPTDTGAPDRQRIEVLLAVKANPRNSATTRAWAEALLERLQTNG